MAAHARCTLRIFERVPPGHLQAPLRGYGALLFARLVGLRGKLRPAIWQRCAVCRSTLPADTSAALLRAPAHSSIDGGKQAQHNQRQQK